jgi:peptide/nickel transport system substrate-binding protein
MKLNRLSKVALVATAAAGLIAGSLLPANAATRSTVVIVTSNALTGINTSVDGQSLTINTDVEYLQNFGFYYYDASPKLVKNTTFGNYRVVSKNPFRVSYTVNPGKVWSDGTPITAVDLLLSHVVRSSSYSLGAGLGDPESADTAPGFNSVGYSGIYDNFHVYLPKLSADKMTMTIEYSSAIPDWEINAPGPAPVHALVHMAEGKKSLQNLSANLAAKAKFEKAFYSYNKKLMTAMGKVWSNDYNIKEVNAQTNPLLLVGNGAYRIRSVVPNGTITMVENPRHKTNPSGPQTNGIKTIQFRIIDNATAAAQALRNQEIDIYAGQPTADTIALLKAIPTAKVIGGSSSFFEHVDLKIEKASGTTAEYTGPFAGDSQKAKDLRTAFLLMYPIDEIVEKIFKPLNPASVRLDSPNIFPAEPGYAEIVKTSGISKFKAGTQSTREAAALALVRKHSAADVKVNLLWGNPDNTRRADIMQLVTAAGKRAGFDVNAPGQQGWSAARYRSDNFWDAHHYAWGKGSLSQESNAGLYCTTCPSNYLGFSSAKIDATYKKLQATLLNPKQRLEQYTIIDKELYSNSVTLPIVQFPEAAGVNAKLQNIKIGPLAPQVVHNYWEWRYTN